MTTVKKKVTNKKKATNKSKSKKDFILPPYKAVSVVSTLSETQDWGITQSNLPQTWKTTRGEGVTVMVLDTGYTAHVDLDGGMDRDKSITTVGGDITDRQFHSTHCCGIIGARQNDMGTVGVAPDCKIITVKVLGDDGTGSFDSIIKGLEYAAEIKPDVVSMSLGAPSGTPKLQAAIKRLYDMNIPCCVAAGNEGPNSTVGYPARYPEAIAVAAYDKSGNIAKFSSPGKEVFLSCPGVDIYSTYGNNTYAKLSGTSMATPFLAGVLALLIAKHRKQEAAGGPNDCKTVEQMKDHLIKYAIDKGQLGKDHNFGWGIPDVQKLIEAREIVVPTPTPPPASPAPPPASPAPPKRVKRRSWWQRLFGLNA